MLRYNDLPKRPHQNDFESDYYQIQDILNTKVKLSLKYEQLKSPEIHSTLMKPITEEILSIFTNNIIPNHLIFIILLLRYEYLIQSENNLISFDFLITKATVCEILSIRMLREYNSLNRINMLFIDPLKEHVDDVDHRFNTLELCVLSKSKKFLSQPVMVRILEKLYNGELINYDNDDEIRDGEKGLLLSNRESVVDYYKFHKLSMNDIIKVGSAIPKHQSFIINFNLIILSVLYFWIMIMKSQKIEFIFWIFSIGFNLELGLKLYFIHWKYLRKIIWNYIDLVLILLIDVSFVIKVYFNDDNESYFRDFFSLIGIILFPRILSIFNNYKFFNLIILSFNKMIWNLFGLIFFFISLISGFYFSFITLNNSESNGEILFNMIKIFFGFTPSVWNNWDNYNLLGKFIQMSFLFLIQFIVSTILAICLSGIFIRVKENNQEEFNFFKATNLILYFKLGKLANDRKHQLINNFLKMFKIIPILLILGYELLITQIKNRFNDKPNDTRESLKNFTFLKPQNNNNNNRRKSKSSQRPRNITRNINKYQSLSTLDGEVHLRTASTDSFFINELLNKKYQIEKTKTNNSIRTKAHKPSIFLSTSYNNNNDEILTRLMNLENAISKINSTEEVEEDDDKSVIMYDIREDISINSHEEEDEEENMVIELSKENTIEEIDQYDSDETF